MTRATWLSIFLAPLLAGCTNELPEEWHLDRTRILAAESSSWAPAAGETLTMSSMSWAPAGVRAVVWRSCLDPAGCQEPAELVEQLIAQDWEAMSPEEQMQARMQAMAAGIVGVEPGLPPEWTAPPGIPEGFPLAIELEGLPEQGEDVELASLVLDLYGPANQAPEITGLSLNGELVEPGAHLELEAEAENLLTLEAQDPEEERLSLSWYSDLSLELSGGFGGGDGGDGGPFGEENLDWNITPAIGEGEVIVVARDPSGAMSWMQVQVQAK